MIELGFTLFDTAIGRCGIAWGERAIVAVQLPERNELATRTRLLRRRADAREASPFSVAANQSVKSLMSGQAGSAFRIVR